MVKHITIYFFLVGFSLGSLSAEASKPESFAAFNENTQSGNLKLATSLSHLPPAPQYNPYTEITHLKPINPPLRLLIDVRSNHSDGSHQFQTLIDLAKKRHIQALAFTEHDRFTIRFGIDPVPYILGYSQEHPSLYQTGLQHFFLDLKQVQQSNDMTLFAGTESTPGYYWTGMPFRDLTLHQAERHLITLGAKNPEQIEALTSYDLRHGYGNKTLSLAFWFVVGLFLLVSLIYKRKRKISLLILLSYIVLMASWLMKPTSSPEEDFINSARLQNLFVIWTHPGTLSGVREGPMGVQLNTPPYSDLVFTDSGADAFAAVYGDTDSNTAPGGLWDQYMMDYISGKRHKAIWAVAAGDYHEEGQANEFLGNFPMDVWAESAKEDDILTALKQGRMVAWGMTKDQNFATKALYVEYVDSQSKQKKQLLTGGRATADPNLQAVIAIQNLDDPYAELILKGQWIVDGNIAAEVPLATAKAAPLSVTPLNLPAGHHVLRFQIAGHHGVRMKSNPFLITVQQ